MPATVEAGGREQTQRDEARFALAEALWQAPDGHGGDRPRALELARQAAEALRADPRGTAARIDEWLRTRTP